ncbi:hypothetical protein KEM60_03048 [Austwickia sp. TVS 96-490-7B]|nr:hypothetical protein [Austwickia sp. TVS 96-490-7B]
MTLTSSNHHRPWEENPNPPPRARTLTSHSVRSRNGPSDITTYAEWLHLLGDLSIGVRNPQIIPVLPR